MSKRDLKGHVKKCIRCYIKSYQIISNHHLRAPNDELSRIGGFAPEELKVKSHNLAGDWLHKDWSDCFNGNINHIILHLDIKHIIFQLKRKPIIKNFWFCTASLSFTWLKIASKESMERPKISKLQLESQCWHVEFVYKVNLQSKSETLKIYKLHQFPCTEVSFYNPSPCMSMCIDIWNCPKDVVWMKMHFSYVNHTANHKGVSYFSMPTGCLHFPLASYPPSMLRLLGPARRCKRSSNWMQARWREAFGGVEECWDIPMISP